MGLFDKIKQLRNFDKTIEEKQRQIDECSNTLKTLKEQIEAFTSERDTVNSERDAEIQKTEIAKQKVVEGYKTRIDKIKAEYSLQNTQLSEVTAKADEAEKKFAKFSSQLKMAKTLYKKIFDSVELVAPLDEAVLAELDLLAPTTDIPLHSYDVKDLRELVKQTNKVIKDTLERYEKRYTSKVNRALYQLMVLALRAEIQNILADLKFTTLNKCQDNLREMLDKYKAIADDGSQTISGTIKNFVDEIGVLFERLIDIEYQYYIRREQAKAEQQALKEQMRQEAEERKQLEAERKQVEREEQKYIDRMNELNEQLSSCTDDNKLLQLQQRIQELTLQLSKVQEKKEEIVNLQNGKAGYVYVISNLGSFGENVFKIGMTRRIDPMDRVKELGSASVPFSFDVHSFIFSDDAVDLEHNLHERLNANRVNKVNLRKEFFRVKIEDLETLVQEIDSTAEFNKTMVATEFYQTQAFDNDYN